MILLFRLLTAIFFTVASLYYVWMFQLNGYFLKRSIKNLLNCPAFYLGVLFSVLQLAVNFLLPKVALYTNFAFAGLLSPFVFFAKKTPIKFTGRVCRWTIVLLLIFICGNLLLKTWFLTILILPLVILSHFILLPIQYTINLYYLKHAQKKVLKMKSTVIVVTGSFGKTSTKNILNAFLQTEYSSICSESSFNTPLGLARFINGLNQNKKFLILEAGAKTKGDIAKICKLFKPTHAIITGIASQHLETFGSLKNIIDTKGEVLDFLTNESICVLNADDINSQDYFKKSGFNAVSVGKNGKNFYFSDLKITPTGTTFSIHTQNDSYNIFTPLLGSVSAHNITLAFALALKLGCKVEKLIETAKNLEYVPHRLQLIKQKDIYILDDGYNANPLGVEGFIEVLNSFDGTKAVVSQGIVEMGNQTVAENYRFAKKLAKVADYCALLGQNTPSLYKGLIDGDFDEQKIFVCENLKEAVSALLPYLSKNSVIAFQNDLPDNMNGQKRRQK